MEGVSILCMHIDKLLWLSINVRPGIALSVLELSKRISEANLKDLKVINLIIKRAKE